MTELFKSITASQYVAALKTLEQSMESASDEIWAEDHIDTAVDQVVFHALFWTDLYLELGMDGFRKQRFHLDNLDMFRDYEELEDGGVNNHYSRAMCKEYMLHCIRKVHDTMEGETEATLRGESGFSWRKCSRAELHIYNIRHIQHHAAQLGLRNQLIGGAPLKWVSGE